MRSLNTPYYLIIALCLLSIAAYADTRLEPINFPVAITTNAEIGLSQPLQTSQVMLIGDAHRFLQSDQQHIARHTSQPGDVDLIMDGRLFPKVQAHMDFTFHPQDADVDVEEAYATIHPFSRVLGARAGVMLVPFGLLNQTESHKVPFADNATVVKNLLGDALIGDGYEMVVSDPEGMVHAHFGQWTTRPGNEDRTGAKLGAGFTAPFTLTHLSFSQYRTKNEVDGTPGLQLGASLGYGPGEGTHLLLMGGDVSWRKNLGGARNIRFQAEAIRRRRDQARPGFQHEFGYYLMGIYQPADKWEIGTRYDWSEIPGQFRTHETALSLFATRHLHDYNYLRLQLKRGGTAPGDIRSTEVIMQIVSTFDTSVK